jgi:hypothetical protein
LDGAQKRYYIGDASVDPKTARRRANRVKENGDRSEKLIR